MYQLKDYTTFEIAFFFRLADKHNHDFELVSRILRSHHLVTQDERYDGDRLTTVALKGLLRQLFEEDNGQQSTGAALPPTNKLVQWNARPDQKLVATALERIWHRIWKRLTNDLISDVHQCDQKIKTLNAQIAEIQRVEGPGPTASSKLPGRNGAAASLPSIVPPAITNPNSHEGRITSGPSPLAAPVPEVIKKRPSPPQPQPQTLKRDSTVPQARTPQPQAPPHPLRQLQPIPPAAKANEPRPNGAAQVLQPPAGVSQTLPPQIAPPPARSASPTTLTPRPDAATRGKPSPSVLQQIPAPPPPLKWETPYQGPQPPSQRPLQPSVARNLAPQPGQQSPAPKWPASPSPAPSGTQTPQTPQPSHPHPSQPVLAPPQTGGQLAPPLLQGPSRSPSGSPVVQQPHPPPQSRSPQPQGIPPTPPQVGQPVFQAPPKQWQGPTQQQHQQQPLQRPAGSASPAHPTAPTGTGAAPQPKRPPPPASHQQAQFSLPPALIAQLRKDENRPPYRSPYSRPPQPVPATTHAAKIDAAKAEAAKGDAAKVDAAKVDAARATLLRRISGILPRSTPQTPAPQTPQQSPSFVKTGHSTRWTAKSTPSTPARAPTPVSMQSPAYEPLSPPLRPSVPTTPKGKPKKGTPRSVQKTDTSARKPRPRAARSGGQRAHRGPQALGSVRRSQSEASQPDELSLDQGDLLSKVKEEESTPRLLPEETGDTTADESATSRRHGRLGSLSARIANKRKRQESEPPPMGPPTQVQWTRGFPKVSASALDQIGSHRHANMFANPIRERDAPNYSGIVLQPQDIQSIKKAITHGNRFAGQAAANLPGGDPGTPVVSLPISEDLVPPKGIINSAQLERELVHMFCNAIMYNPDPDRGPGEAFMRLSYRTDGVDSLGYKVDEFGVVKHTENMFLEVEKLLSDLRNAENQRNPALNPPLLSGPTRTGSVVTGGDDTADDMDELAQDDVSTTSRKKRVKA